MRRGTLELSLFATLWLGGCAPSLSLGSPCVLASDCPEPFACLGGRCREECATARDCYPFACVEVEGGLGACRVIEDDACDGCTAPLTCVAGACVDPCANADGCSPGSECVSGACVPPDEPPLGACSPLAAASGCGEAEVCTRSGETFACAPAPAAATALGGPCSSDVACGTGAGCVSGRCALLCVAGTTSCGPGSFCSTDATLFGPLTSGTAPGPRPPAGLGYCTEVCDLLAPFESDGCLDGNVCAFGVTGGGRHFTYCRDIVEPQLGVYGSCAPDEVMLGEVKCPAGTGCSIVPPGTARLCRPFCDPAAAAPCADGSACSPVLIGNRRYGVCTGPG